MTQKKAQPDRNPPQAGRVGAPSKFSDDKEAMVISVIANGGTINDAAKAIKVDPSTIKRWLAHEEREDFRAQYARARESQADAFADEIIDVARDDRRDPQQARLLVDALKWAAGKRKPKVYGDKLELSGDEKSPLTVNVITRFEGAP
jgi:transposase